jgi:hypothetical protein
MRKLPILSTHFGQTCRSITFGSADRWVTSGRLAESDIKIFNRANKPSSENICISGVSAGSLD